MSTVTGRIVGGRPWRLWAALAGALVLGGIAGGVIMAAARGSTPSQECSATTVADNALPSVVTINVQGETAAGNGSGEIIRSSGEILTNNHVIAAAANGGSIQVVFSDGVTTPATLVGRDPLTDLAVIKPRGQHAYPTIPLGSSRDVRVGQPVIALGAPLGLSSTVTSGIVSALDRTIEVLADNGKTALLVSAIQTDAAINPGNSGGALVDCAAHLVGVPTAGATAPSPTGQPSSGSIGLGFAIPVDLAKSISDEIIASGTVNHSYFGIEVVAIPPFLVRQRLSALTDDAERSCATWSSSTPRSTGRVLRGHAAARWPPGGPGPWQPKTRPPGLAGSSPFPIRRWGRGTPGRRRAPSPRPRLPITTAAA